MEARRRNIVYYLPASGLRAPFGLWRDSLVDKRVRAAVDARVTRLAGGNFSDSKAIGSGAMENRIDMGPGYRIYYAVDGEDIILLGGGGKSSQRKDIEIANSRWNEYKERKRDSTRELQRRSSQRSSK